jgi:O-antigen ligase
MKFIVPILVLIFLSISRLSDITFIKLIPLSILALYVFYGFHVVNIKQIKINRLIVVLFLIILVSLIRTNNPESKFLFKAYEIIEFFLLMLSLVLYNTWAFKIKKLTISQVLFSLTILPFSIYCFLNLFAWSLGISFNVYHELFLGKAILLSNFGINIERVQFPFVSGINSFASVVGSVLVLSLSFYFNTKKNKVFVMLSLITFTIILFLLDSRTSLVYPFLSLFFIWFFRFYKLKKPLMVFPILPFILPVLLLLFLQIFQNSSFINSVSRNNEDVSSANGRLVIWGTSLIELMNFKSIHLIGYGQYGHFASGASKIWSVLFSKWRNSELIHPHNTVLMIFFDYGYIGLVFFVVFLYNIMKKIYTFWEVDKFFANVFLSFMIYFLLIGISESYFGMYYLNAMYIFLAVIMTSDFYISYRLKGI